MYRAVYSKNFFEKLRERKRPVVEDVNKAIQRVLLDPNNNLYIRHYLTPFKQEHPSDKTITIFFEVNDSDKYVYFVWINDSSCPHDTHQSFGSDPCVKEFLRLRGLGDLEGYIKIFHEGFFEVAPRPPTMPRFLSFTKYDTKVYCNILNDGTTYYSLSLETDALDENELFDHYERFLDSIVDYFKNSGEIFEFRLNTHSYQDIIQILQRCIDSSKWTEFVDQDLTIFRMT